MSKQPEALRVKSREQFNWLIDHITTETHRAHDHSNLWRDLDSAFDEYCEEFSQSPLFWQLTRQALQDSVILRLGRLFDPHNGSLSLGSLLQTIRSHATATVPTFLTPVLSGLDLGTIDLELASVSETESSVAALMTIRNQYLAHREARLVGTGSFSSLPPLEREKIQSLLARALQIVNKYRRMCGLESVSSTLHGGDDYQHLLALLRSGLNTLKAREIAPD